MASFLVPSTTNGMIMGALFHVIGFHVASQHRGSGRSYPKGVFAGQIITGAIGGGLGAMFATSFFPDNQFAFVVSVVAAVMTYDHLLIS